MSHPNELLIPPKANADQNGVELLRAWGAAGGLQVSLAAEVWDDAGNWGVALADVIRHLGNAYKETQGIDERETVSRIMKTLVAELRGPTDKPTGSVLK
ncbi:MAG TPA: DUF5076 domain-containing protein [Opitutaceae bacterium]|nr:DUF5076 domain-containing protein [Opitutaceae bacterium]